MLPTLGSIDHIHVFVTNREAATAWYRDVLGLTPVVGLEFWAQDGGPLTVADAGGRMHVALFESAPIKCRSTIAFGVTAVEFVAWREHLQQKLARPIGVEDHGVTWSLYFRDPDDNPYEITTFEYSEAARLLNGQ